MSNDLISRKVVMEYLSELCETKDTAAYGSQLMGNYEAMKFKLAERDCIKNIMQNIRGFNCAYDVDKVVEALEIKSIPCNEKGKCIWTEENQLGCEECVKRKAVEIVKGGGVDE